MNLTRARVESAASGGSITVRMAGNTTSESVSCARDVAAVAVAGDWVAVIEQDGFTLAIALLGTGPGAAPAPTADLPTTATTTGTQVLAPTWSGTFRGGSWRSSWSDLVQGPSSWGVSQGAAFYGRGPSSLGTLTGGRLSLRREEYGIYGAGAPTLVLLGASAPGAGYPAILRTEAGPSLPNVGSMSTWTVPALWLADLQSGAAGGIGISNAAGPYMRLDGPSTILTLDWSR